MDFGDTIVVEEEGKQLSDMQLCPVNGVEDFLKEFSEQVTIVILSNTIHSREDDIRKLIEQLGFISYIDKIITSLDMGVAKPDPKIYEIALQQLNLKADEVLMIGDRLDTDILGAEKANILSLHLHWRDRHDEKSKSVEVHPTYKAENYTEVKNILRPLV